tara:strand:- start:362 stop:469 length:108 start_codon:yes stop_codon:yes gene_type:complete
MGASQTGAEEQGYEIENIINQTIQERSAMITTEMS